MASSAAVQVNVPQIDDRIGTWPVSDGRSTCDVRGGAQAAQGAVGGVVDGQGGWPEQAGSSTSAEEGRAPVSSSREIISPGTSQRRPSVPAEHEQSQTDSLATVKPREEVEDPKRKIEQPEALEKAAAAEEEKKTSEVLEQEKTKKKKKKKKKTKKELETTNEKLEKDLKDLKEFEKRLAEKILKLKEDIDGPPTLVFSEELEEEKKTPQGPSAEQLKRIQFEKDEAESLRKFLLKEYKACLDKANATRWWPWEKPKRSLTTRDIENQLTPVLPEAYLEIKRLLWVEGQKVLKKALEVWQEKEVLFIKRVERKKSKVAELKNEVYQLVGFFSVFQGVVLTAVAQASQLHCSTSWIPISLSILASVVTIAAVIQKFDQISAFQKTVHSEEQSLKEVIARQSNLKGRAETFRFARFFDNRKAPEQKRSQQFFYFAFVIISLLAFTVLFPVSFWKVLCG